MRRILSLILLVLSLCLLLSSCDAIAVPYTLKYNSVNDSDEPLDIKLYGKSFENGSRYGIGKIKVKKGGEELQTIILADEIPEEDLEPWFDGYTECREKSGSFELLDINFDGVKDFRLMGWLTTGGNTPYYYWIWNSETQRYEYAYTLGYAEFDSKTQTVTVAERSNAASGTVTKYKYDEQGKLHKAYSEDLYYNA